MNNFRTYYEEQIVEETECKRPCRYNKYFNVHKLVHRLVGEDMNENKIAIKFENKMLVRNETLVISGETFIAEMGGALGLFLGFSFTMIVNWFEYLIDMIKKHFVK